MAVTANEILSAIEVGNLDARLGKNCDQIEILIAGQPVAAVGCLKIDRPKAQLGFDGISVDVFPSPGMPDGFAIYCDGHEPAILIAESLDERLESAYLDLVDPRR